MKQTQPKIFYQFSNNTTQDKTSLEIANNAINSRNPLSMIKSKILFHVNKSCIPHMQYQM